MMKSLYVSAVQTIVNYFVIVAEILLREETASFIDIVELFERLHTQARELPAIHLRTIVNIFLVIACLLSRLECSSKRESAIRHLVSMVARLRPKKIDFPICYGDENPLKVVHSAVFDSLKEMKQLERLKFRFLRGNTSGEQKFFSSCAALKNLLVFSCSDATNEIVQAICKHCPLIQEIKVSCAAKVSDRCIKSLIKCKKLQVVDLSFTAVSIKGREKLLLKTKSENLQYIGYVDDLQVLLNRLERKSPRIFPLRFLSGDGDMTNLEMVATLFPNVIRVKLEFNGKEQLTPDISVLDRLKNVRYARVRLYPDSADVFTNFKSQILTNLELDYWSSTRATLEIKITTIMKIGLQCPNIECLSLTAFSFVDDTSSTEFYELVGKPFQKLRDLFWLKCYEVSCFKVILGHTFSIQNIDVNDGFLADEFFEYILNNNPLERLESLILGSENGVSASVIKRIITQCKQISSIGDFSQCAALTDEQVQEIKSLIVKKGSTIEMKFDYD